MLSFECDAEKHFVIISSLVGQLELLFLPPVSHLRKPDNIREYLYFNHIILTKLEA
jgi:hypothetical protein